MAGKKIKGRKRHIVVDTEGHILHIKVHAANIHDTVAGGSVFEETVQKYPSLLGVCGDDGYRGTFVNFVTNTLHKTVEISKRISQT
jgi:putative transposase